MGLTTQLNNGTLKLINLEIFLRRTLMKKYIKFALVFLVLGLVFGVFYREFSKAYGIVNTYATLGLVHVHFLVLGVVFTLIIGLIINKLENCHEKLFKSAFLLYAIGVLGVGLMLAVRGILDILVRSDKIQFAVSAGANGAIAGISGLFHAILGIGIVLIFVSWLFNKTRIPNDSENKKN